MQIYASLYFSVYVLVGSLCTLCIFIHICQKLFARFIKKKKAEMIRTLWNLIYFLMKERILLSQFSSFSGVNWFILNVFFVCYRVLVKKHFVGKTMENIIWKIWFCDHWFKYHLNFLNDIRNQTRLLKHYAWIVQLEYIQVMKNWKSNRTLFHRIRVNFKDEIYSSNMFYGEILLRQSLLLLLIIAANKQLHLVWQN